MTVPSTGRYELVDVVASGGQGSVVKAIDTLHDRTVAIKVRRAGTAEAARALTTEGRVLFGIRPHAGVTILREDVLEDSAYFMVMDWVEGTTLEELVSRHGRPGVGLRRTVDYISQAAEALDHLHAHDPPIVHRDVKPANLVLSRDGRLVLVDFGITSAGLKAGTLSYAAPEVASGDPATPRSDVYSLAVTAYALLTGGPPVLGERPSWPGLEAADAARVQAAIARGMSLDPDGRPASAGELAASLRAPQPVARRGNLPAETSSLVGRQQDVTDVHSALEKSRIVTLTGPGGVGKTRLAIRVASSADAPTVWFAELAAVTRDVAAAVASVLGAGEDGGRSVTESISAAIGTEPVLLVLDNCEHVVDECAALTSSLLRACPTLRVLATSRRPLSVAGESVHRVAPLDAASDAVALFAERAKAANPKFVVGDEVARICRSLDGLPLAIEIAAARSYAMSAADILRRLDDRLSLPGPRDAPERHRSLNAALEWGYELLDESHRSALRRLSVLPGGFTLQTASAVLDADPVGPVEALVDASFLSASVDDGPTRYTMLETVLAFAKAQLEMTGGERDLARADAVRWARTAAAESSPDEIDREIPNFVAAISYGGPDAVAVAGELGRYWLTRGLYTQGRALLAAALKNAAEPAVRAKALNAAGGLALAQGDLAEAEALFEQSLEHRRATGDEPGIAAALNNLGIVARESGDLASAARYGEECLAIQRRIGDERGLAAAVHNQGLVALARDDYRTARELLEESRSMQESSGDEVGAAGTSINLGVVALAQGRYSDARGLLEDSLVVCRDHGDIASEAACLHNLALVARDSCRPDESRRLFDDARRIYEEVGDEPAAAACVAGLGALALDAGDHDESRRLLTQALKKQECLDDTDGRAYTLAFLGMLAVRTGEPGAADFLRESLQLKPSLRSAAECLELLAAATGDDETACRMLACASAVRTAIGAPPSDLDAPGLESLADALRARLGPRFETVWAESSAPEGAADRAFDLVTKP